jgi:hemolysin III
MGTTMAAPLAVTFASPTTSPTSTSTTSTTTSPAVAHVGVDRPRLRGRLHQGCFLASIPAGTQLWAHATSPTARVAAVAFALTWTAMFGTSAAYHRYSHGATAVRWMRRADHSMIFVHIGGASTALTLLTTPGVLGWVLVALVWSGVAVGVGVKVTRVSETCTGGSWLYPVVGATMLVGMPVMLPTLGSLQVALLLGALGLYGTGAALFFQKRPDPLPTVFGYHEVWHCFTLAAGLCQFALVATLVAG